MEGLQRAIAGMVRDYWIRMLEDSGIGACTSIRVDPVGGLPPSGLYSALTAYLVLSVIGSEEGGGLVEVLEVARHADDSTEEWPGVVDALRMASLSKGPVVYRNDEEYMKLPAQVPGGLSYARTMKAGRPLITRESVGSEVYSALIHLMGVSVVEAARSMMDTGDFWSPVSRFLPIHAGVAEAVWGIKYKRGCLPSPGIPGRFEVLCHVV